MNARLLKISKLEALEQWLYDHQVILIEDNSLMDYDCLDKAFSIKYKSAACIVYAPGAILNDVEKRFVLLHEIYHMVIKNGFYYLNDSPQKRKMVEGRVKNKMIKDLVPLETLIEFIERKLTTYEMAEELEVPEEVIIDAYQLYYANLQKFLNDPAF